MNFMGFQDMLTDAMYENTLIVVALLVFALIIFISAAVIYAMACAKNKATQMTGLIQVRVSLNEWPDNTPHDACPRLVFGDYLISMKDPSGIQNDRLDPHLTGLKKASCREYAVGTLLQRFYANYESAGMYADPSGRLLRELLKDNNFCRELGSISRKNDKKGLRASPGVDCKKDGKDLDKLSVYLEVPEDCASTFRAATNCEAKMLCITMQYLSRTRNEAGV